MTQRDLQCRIESMRTTFASILSINTYNIRGHHTIVAVGFQLRFLHDAQVRTVFNLYALLLVEEDYVILQNCVLAHV